MFLLLFLLILLATSTYADGGLNQITFINPPYDSGPENNPVWSLGSVQKLEWSTFMKTYHITLYSPSEGSDGGVLIYCASVLNQDSCADADRQSASKRDNATSSHVLLDCMPTDAATRLEYGEY